MRKYPWFAHVGAKLLNGWFQDNIFTLFSFYWDIMKDTSCRQRFTSVENDKPEKVGEKSSKKENTEQNGSVKTTKLLPICFREWREEKMLWASEKSLEWFHYELITSLLVFPMIILILHMLNSVMSSFDGWQENSLQKKRRERKITGQDYLIFPQ